MLDLLGSLRKNSFRAGLDQVRNPGRFTKTPEVFPGRARKQRERQRLGKLPVAEQSAPDRGPQAPPGMSGDDLEDRRLRLHRRLNDVRLGREPVLEDGGQNPGVPIQAEHDEGPAAHRFCQIHPLGQGHLRESAKKVPVRGASNLRMDPSVGGKMSQVPPEQGRNEGKRFSPRGPRMSSEREANRVIATRGTIRQEPFEGFRGEVGSLEELEVVAFAAHDDRAPVYGRRAEADSNGSGPAAAGGGEGSGEVLERPFGIRPSQLGGSNESGADDDPVCVPRRGAGRVGSRDPESDRDRQAPRGAPGPSHRAGNVSGKGLAGPCRSRPRDDVEKAAREPRRLLHPNRSRGWRNQKDRVEPGLTESRVEFPGLLGRQIGYQHSVKSGGFGFSSGFLSTAQKRIQVGEEDQGHAGFVPDPAGDLENRFETGATRERTLGCPLKHWTVRDRIGKRNTQLQDVGARPIERDGERHRLVGRRISGGEICDEGGAVLSARPIEDSSDS
jgi:hypothetical protein